MMKDAKCFGSNFDEIAVKIFNKVDTLSQINMVTRKKVIGIYEDSLDNLPFLNGADDIKAELVRIFKTEFDAKYNGQLWTNKKAE